MENKNQKQAFNFLVVVFSFFFFLFTFMRHSLFAESKTIDELTNCLCAGKGGEAACLEELKEAFFKDNQYGDFVETLKGLCPANKAIEPAVSYYIALSRYAQLKYLEEAKEWDEYFARGNEYRDDIVNSAQKAAGLTAAGDALHIDSLLLLYRFHKDQMDAFSEPALADLMAAVNAYAQAGADTRPIRDAAAGLADYGEKGKSKELYKLYARQLAGLEIKDAELKAIAADFYQKGNLELSEHIYDIYIERITKGIPKETLIAELSGIARDFAYKDGALNDPLYAEKAFRQIEETGGKEAFDEGLMYLRGFNLEKAKAFNQAKDIYLEFLKTFPQSSRADELTYKTGIIFIYILRDLKSGRAYLEGLAKKEVASSYSLDALYQLGMLKQWEGEFSPAKEYYDRLLVKLGENGHEDSLRVKERLNELAQNIPLEYNLKIGLDTALREEFAGLDMSKVSLKPSAYLPEKGKEIEISSVASLGPTGCLQTELQYLWSQDLGGHLPAPSQSAFQTSYKTAGTKLIVMVLVAPEGITERGVDLLDVR
ncbi:MAG: hypothetical protein WC478_01390 [Candidatus Omnitrophota bacterium]